MIPVKKRGPCGSGGGLNTGREPWDGYPPYQP
jgi:hypothetical protein